MVLIGISRGPFELERWIFDCAKCEIREKTFSSASNSRSVQAGIYLMTDVEKHARRVIEIMKDAGVGAAELMNCGAIEATWQNGDAAGLQAGLQ
jgi:hypothetical protein